MKRTTGGHHRVRNQRLSNTRQRRQQHLLDVKVRSRKATQHRNRRVLVWISKITLAILLAAGLVVGLRYGAQKLFFENPDYRLTHIELRTDGTLSREQALQATGLREGENIFRINLEAAREALQQLPQVDDVQVFRKLPSEIAIHIVERKPIAWITAADEITDPFASESAFLIDARGTLMKEKKLLPEYLGLPLITGCKGEPLRAGERIESPEAVAALEFLRLSARSFMQTRFQVREIDISSGYALVVTDKNRTRVTFGFQNLLPQLRRLEQFLVYADDSDRELATVNLLVQRNVPVTFTKTAAEIINDTVDSEFPAPVEARVMKATPVIPKATATSGPETRRATPVNARRAIPVKKPERKKKNVER